MAHYNVDGRTGNEGATSERSGRERSEATVDFTRERAFLPRDDARSVIGTLLAIDAGTLAI